MGISDNFKRGTIELLALTLLQEKEMYGYELIQELEQRSNNRYHLQEATLYPSLYRLLERELITDRREQTGKRRFRIYYSITEKGKDYLSVLRTEYLNFCLGVLSVLDIKTLEEMKNESKLE